jgi:hypothetical protein
MRLWCLNLLSSFWSLHFWLLSSWVSFACSRVSYKCLWNVASFAHIVYLCCVSVVWWVFLGGLFCFVFKWVIVPQCVQSPIDEELDSFQLGASRKNGHLCRNLDIGKSSHFSWVETWDGISCVIEVHSC